MTSPQLHLFLDRARGIVGEAHVYASDDERLDTLRDRFGAYYETEHEPRPGGAVRPASTEEVQAIVRLANETGVALWTSSRGRNFGYGGPAPVRRGDVALDLQRMNRILEIDEKRAYAVVEPGVATGELLAEIERRGLKLWPGTTSSPYSSIIGNALERGIGYDIMSERFESLCGLEVVLADGTLVRTGSGSMDGSTVWHENKYGYGPIVDGLFSQSNFGIVTKAGFWLSPEPAAFRHSELYLEDFSRMAEFMDILGDLRRRRILENGVSSGPDFPASAPGDVPPPHDAAPAGPPPQRLRSRLGWHGPRSVIDAKWEATLAALQGIDGLTYDTAVYEAPYDYTMWNANARMAAGLPTDLEEPDWENAHYGLFIAPVIPNIGEAYVEVWNLINEVFERHGRVGGMPPGFHMHSARSLVVIPPVPLKGMPMLPNRGADIDNAVSVALVSDLIHECAQRGWTEYRAGTLFMDQVLAEQDFAGGTRAELYERIKNALDPNGILSPGKSGIWGSATRPASAAPGVRFGVARSED
ncbi:MULTISPECIES: FAD-binding oxidoreductase [unclassified Microbacterium]|uniref:FAD-binding oxidoreductase n=1 Tax=unclassified Microbacterium TaxID=2609290 RepID=UPI00214BA1B6|nr:MULTISPECIES: FAD-binding oxidoreductase [unclassified Microbacterium]MCR2783981.1 FAD-binding oxidoreductase [Microbacterium sp. zg.B96]WIM15175.1 FAD-binding oxidoreductase [Microbacterium sp. zg-B96]